MAKTNKPRPGDQPTIRPRSPIARVRPKSSTPPPSYRRRRVPTNSGGGGCKGCGK